MPARIAPSTAALLSVLSLGSAASAATYFEVFSEAQADINGNSIFLDSAVVVGSDVLAISRDTSGIDFGEVTRMTGFGAGATGTPVMTNAQWNGGAGSDFSGFFGANVVNGGTTLRVMNFFDNNVWDVDLATGVPTIAIPVSTFETATGGSVNLTATNAVLLDGTVLVYDGTSDTILQASVGGSLVSTAVSASTIASLTGSSSLAGTALELIGNTLYFGSNIGDSLYSYNLFTGAGGVVLDTAALESLTDDIDGSAGIDDIFFAPDGLMYIYEDDSDYILSFDPLALDVAASLQVVLTEQELNDGPGTDGVSQFDWYQGGLAWTDQSDGFYALVPEPATAALLGLGGLAMLRRRSV